MLQAVLKRLDTLELQTKRKGEAVPPCLMNLPALPKPTRWSGVIKDAIVEGQWKPVGGAEGPMTLAFPVVQRDGQGKWEPHDWKILQQARTTVSTYGLKSEATRQIVSWIFSADLMCPYDCQNLMRLLLTPTQYLLWMSSWQQRAINAAAQRQRDGDPLRGITADMLVGQGPYSDYQVQITFPANMLQLSAQLALEAFLSLPGSNVPSFSNLQQGATEKYSNFVDRLWEAIMNHPDLSEDNRQQMFKILAFDNANKTTRQMLASLPKGAGVEEMLLRVERAETQRQGNTVAAAVQGAVREIMQPLVAVVQKKQGPTPKGKPRRPPGQPFRGSCFRCGESGHMKTNCRAAVWCDHCQKNNHATKACSGNWKPSAERGRAQTQMNPQNGTRVFYNTTRGSLGVDVETTVDVTLVDSNVQKVPSNVIGPLVHQESNVGGLLLGRSSAGIQGLIVLPGVIDADYTGRIYIMVYTVCPPVFIPKGSKIAQIVAISNPLTHMPQSNVRRGNQGFGSTGPAVCFTTKLNQRPTMKITITQQGTSQQIDAMLDTGADVTIISRNIWPSSWPVELPTSSIAGVGGQSVPYISKHPIHLQFPEGQHATLKVYVLPLPGTLEALIGRDVLSQIGAVLTTKHF
ncbi:hypothetical protein QYF61_021277 [Mycteria americana]|uniref:Uncharacterized protein n=1 Tax=Mycteria americana TaxID=33587 RepID=A0AAN7NGV6_MYCAM|nr:hypothetical protein QYF61_021277 [Mycteria americana]